MGRKIRRIIVLAMAMVLLLSWQKDTLQAADEGKQPIQEEEKPEETENPEEPESPEEPEGPEEPEQPEEPITKYQVHIPNPDGKKGFYVTKPDVKIQHVSKRGITLYEVCSQREEPITGKLDKPDSEAVIKGSDLAEGTNTLIVWMEDEEGNILEEYTQKEELQIDTRPPALHLETVGGNGWHQESAVILAVADDGAAGSGVAWLYGMAGQQMIGQSEQPKAQFQVTDASTDGKGVEVNVRVTDQAGNENAEKTMVYIDRIAPKVGIEGAKDYMITSQDVKLQCHASDENVLSLAQAVVKRITPDGASHEEPVDRFTQEQGRQSVSLQLKEDGLYQIHLTAKDGAGYESTTGLQVIIDKKNPVVRYVDQMQGKYYQSFQWEYPSDSWIEDFTTFSYTVQLDGKVYVSGQKITQEGPHTLEVKAIDSAGNVGTAQARFIVDHTPPDIVFENLEAGQEYEESRSFRIAVKGTQDSIQEVRINGKKQTVTSQKKAYDYTLQEPQYYEVTVLAADKAGNKRESTIGFHIKEKQNVVSKIKESVKEYFVKVEGNESETEAPEQIEKSVGFEIGPAIICLAGIPLIGIAIYCYKREQEKYDEEDEDHEDKDEY